jgi:hypothetical protein
MLVFELFSTFYEILNDFILSMTMPGAKEDEEQ